MRMKSEASVTVFTTLVYLLIAAVITTSIRSVRIQAAKTMVATSLMLALDSVWAGYDRELFDTWGVLFLDGAGDDGTVDEDALAEAIADYCRSNLNVTDGIYFSGGNDLYGITLQGIGIDEVKTATDDGGMLWMESVVDYEKYAKTISLVAEFLNLDTSVDTTLDYGEAAGKAAQCILSVNSVREKLRNVVQYIDGVIVPSEGIVLGRMEYSDSFLKSFLPGQEKEDLEIDNAMIQYKVHDYIVRNKKDPLALIESAIEAEAGGQTLTVKMKLSSLSALAGEACEAGEFVLRLLAAEESSEEKLTEHIDELCSYLEEHSESLGETFTAELTEGVGELSDVNDILDTETAVLVIEENLRILRELMELIDSYTEDGGAESLEQMHSLILAYSYEGLRICYDDLVHSQSSSTNLFTLLKEYSELGALAMACPDDRTLSIRSYEPVNPASDLIEVTEAEALARATEADTLLLKRVIYDEYVMDRFNSFTDEETGTVFDYEVEYILFGQEEDRMNLSYTVEMISLMRFLQALAYICTDEDKKSEAEAYAQAFADWTESEAVVRLVQYLLLMLWAEMEAYSDAKILLSGGKLSLIKTKDNWQTTIDQVFTKQVNPDVDACKTGLDYEDFLRAMLLAEEDGRRSGYTMNLIEAWKKASGETEFSFSCQLYGVGVSALYTVRGGLSDYTYSAGYSY